MRWDELSKRVLGGKLTTYKQALGILESSDDDLLAVLHNKERIMKKDTRMVLGY